ncbi:MAG: alpha/beta hydrolase, partial [Deltaproteobacteria bacterium]|nr:alpha/beta hydrolase [Deltaproteobacteria bacterium]
HHIGWQVLATLVFARLGALHSWPGKLGLLIAIVSWVSLWRFYFAGRAAEAVMERALVEALGPDYRARIRSDLAVKFPSHPNWRRILRPFPMRDPEVERVRDIRYSRINGLNLKLDVYRHKSRPQNCPTLLQIHGGGWVIGSKNEQGIPLMLHLAARGWVCVTVDYRLSPHATFPDHLVDVKRSIQWIREHGAEYGANPDFIVVSGGSAGGHLAALVGLTANDPEYQPGFEDVDTSMRACVPFYGVYDFVDRHQTLHSPDLHDLLETRVMKASRGEAPEAYEKASPIARVHSDVPPMLVIHGDRDTLVPLAQAHRFVDELRAVSKNPVAFAEIPGAQHAFEIFPSLRQVLAIHGTERFLAFVYSQYLARQAPSQNAQAA